MAEVVFNFNGKKTIIQCNKNETMASICQRFASKVNESLDTVYFLYAGQSINNSLNFEQHAQNEDRVRNKMDIIVNSTDVENPEVFHDSKDIICPQCQETCLINIEDYKINLYGCKNRHKTKNLPLMDFDKSQKINYKNIECEGCKSINRSETYNNEFYLCTCGKKLCPLCKNSHEKNFARNSNIKRPSGDFIKHKIFRYDEKNYRCNIHNELYISYCKKCHENMCMLCQTEKHKEHDNIILSAIMPKEDDTIKEISDIKKKVDKVKNDIQKIINNITKIRDYIDKSYSIILKIFKSYSVENRNYHIIENIDTVKKSDFIDDINKLYKEKIFINKLYYLSNIINKINSKNEITLRYKIFDENESIKIFDSEFVNKYRNICKIIYKDKELELVDYFKPYKLTKEDGNILEIKLTGVNKITDMSSMFYSCTSLVSLPDISDWNTYKVNNMSKLFKGCSLLSYLPRELQWNTINVTNMEGMFSGCSSLKNFPDFSNWNTMNVEYMNEMFQDCKSFDSRNKFPDISKWNTSNVIKLSQLFKGCSSLISLPDISTWNTRNVREIDELFRGCKSLKSLPDISKWNTINLTNMDRIFSECKSLQKLPDISKWNTSNVISMDSVFSECSSLTELPDISEWKTDNVVDMSYLFSGCSKLTKLPDISEWDLSKVNKMGFIFSQCTSLKELPDISKWNTSNVTFMGGVFNECSNLKKLPDISKWDVSKVNYMSCMFFGCAELTDLPDISVWNTEKVTDMSCLFSGCSKLKNLPELKRWKTSNLKRLNSMFNGCNSLSEEDKSQIKKDCLIF